MLSVCIYQQDPKFTTQPSPWYELQNTLECCINEHFCLVFYQAHQQETSLLYFDWKHIDDIAEKYLWFPLCKAEAYE